MNSIEICNRATATWGVQDQLYKAAEECVELANAIFHYDGINTELILDEMADVSIMIDQLKTILSISSTALDNRISYKWIRLEDRLDSLQIDKSPIKGIIKS